MSLQLLFEGRSPSVFETSGTSHVLDGFWLEELSNQLLHVGRARTLRHKRHREVQEVVKRMRNSVAGLAGQLAVELTAKVVDDDAILVCFVVVEPVVGLGQDLGLHSVVWTCFCHNLTLDTLASGWLGSCRGW